MSALQACISALCDTVLYASAHELAMPSCSYPFTPEVVGRLAADPSVMALAPHTLPEAEGTMAYLDLLIRDLKRRGFDTHVLPLFQLQRLVAKLALRNEVRTAHCPYAQPTC